MPKTFLDYFGPSGLGISGFDLIKALANEAVIINKELDAFSCFICCKFAESLNLKYSRRFSPPIISSEDLTNKFYEFIETDIDICEHIKYAKARIAAILLTR